MTLSSAVIVVAGGINALFILNAVLSFLADKGDDHARTLSWLRLQGAALILLGSVLVIRLVMEFAP